MLDSLLYRLVSYCFLLTFITGTAFAQLEPSLAGNSAQLTYTENQGALTVDASLTVFTNVSSKQVLEGYVQISGNYDLDEDSLIISLGSTPIAAVWDEPLGRYRLGGFATGGSTNDKALDYQALFRSIQYINKSDTPNVVVRTVSFQVTDANGTSNTFTRNIGINPVNDAPWYYNSNSSIPADTLVYTAEEDKLKNIFPNAYDLEGDGYTVAVSSTAETEGTVVVNGANPKSVDFLSAPDFVGTDYFELSICDENDGLLCTNTVFKVNVTQVNDPPRILNFGARVDSIYYGADPDSLIDICIETLDLEGDNSAIQTITTTTGDPYQYGTVSQTGDLCFDYDANPDALGSEFLKVIICDDNPIAPRCDSVVIQVQIPTVNTAPAFATAGKDTVIIGGLVNEVLEVAIQVTDRERDDIILTRDTVLMGNLDSLSASIVGDSLKFTYHPNPDDSATQAVLRFNICDDRPVSLCSELTVIVPINYLPVLVNDAGGIVNNIYLPLLKNTQIDSCVSMVDFNSNSVFESSITSTAQGTLISSVDNTNDRICMNYTPDTDFIGLDTVTLTICDNGDPEGCTDIEIVCEVFETNTAPVLTDADLMTYTATFEVNENDTISMCLPFVDVEGDSVYLESFDSLSGPGNFTFELSGTNICMNYLPDLNQYGTAETMVTICDDNDYPICQTYVVALNLNPVNYTPILGVDEIEIFNADEFTMDLLDNDADPEDEGLFIVQDQTPATVLGDIVIENDSVIRYIPNPDEYKGTDEIIIIICDKGIPEVCVESILKVKFTLPIPPLKAYEAFSPNGDGINDVWWIDGITEFPNNTVYVTDQYYNVIYEAKGYDNHGIIWTGTSLKKSGNGPADDGTYYYVVDTGTGKRLTGFVVLKR
ncbi:tandem-95 repeat protein [Marinoscillum sp. MHG1-6]|uniref:tandem-95 repeat protein n=1 Tax=Marinoscillum sp. MHG1-6 TaxID=2959627 RepID=UPI0021578FAB|nr:Ig-like domain-containing protein [Marinoscillum sp. MHG1-6]